MAWWPWRGAGLGKRRPLRVLIAAGVLLAAAACAALWWAVQQTRELEAAHQASVQVVRETTGLLMLTQEVLLYGEPRARDQWQARYRRLVAAGKPKMVAIIATARKLLTILNAIIRDQKPWRAS